MLSIEDNRLLTEVGPGTPMGSLLREYWTPAVRSARLVAGGAPVRVGLFGQSYVAFRGDDGRVGFLDEACPHRGASLVLARNEDCALRCLYHGWKIDVEGCVVEVPSEPADRAGFADKVKVNRYGLHEEAGIVWVYVGAQDVPPPFPAYPFAGLPADHVRPLAAETSCNWFQGIEGTIDSSHVGTLHRSWVTASKGGITSVLRSSSPRYDVEIQPYGARLAAIRNGEDGRANVRITEFLMPWTALIPTGDEDRVAIIATPIDDGNSRQWFIRWNEHHPLTEDTDMHEWYKDLTVAPDDFTVLVRDQELWGQDRRRMAEGHFSGFSNLIIEDVAIQESQGAIVDRTREHLGSSDIGVIKARRLYLDAVRAYQRDGNVYGREAESTLGGLGPMTFDMPAGEDWRAAAEAHHA